MFEENFPTCNVCGKSLVSDADMRVAKYCKLCGMLTESMKKFCCEKCERTFKWFVKKKKGVILWKKSKRLLMSKECTAQAAGS